MTENVNPQAGQAESPQDPPRPLQAYQASKAELDLTTRVAELEAMVWKLTQIIGVQVDADPEDMHR